MLTSKEQEILDNAPEWAVYYYWCGNSGKYHYSQFAGQATIESLRKKQGKTVIELFDGHKYSFYVDDKPYIGIYKIVRNAFFSADIGNKICGRSQANDIKLKSEPNAPDTPITPPEPLKENKMSEEKSRVKVWYVKVKGSIFDLKDDFEDGKLYCQDENDFDYCVCKYGESNLIDDYVHGNLYRKVETEIKTEKRWLIYNPSGKFLTEHKKNNFVYHESNQVIEITVEV